MELELELEALEDVETGAAVVEDGGGAAKICEEVAMAGVVAAEEAEEVVAETAEEDRILTGVELGAAAEEGETGAAPAFRSSRRWGPPHFSYSAKGGGELECRPPEA